MVDRRPVVFSSWMETKLSASTVDGYLETINNLKDSFRSNLATAFENGVDPYMDGKDVSVEVTKALDILRALSLTNKTIQNEVGADLAYGLEIFWRAFEKPHELPVYFNRSHSLGSVVVREVLRSRDPTFINNALKSDFVKEFTDKQLMFDLFIRRVETAMEAPEEDQEQLLDSLVEITRMPLQDIETSHLVGLLAKYRPEAVIDFTKQEGVDSAAIISQAISSIYALDPIERTIEHEKMIEMYQLDYVDMLEIFHSDHHMNEFVMRQVCAHLCEKAPIEDLVRLAAQYGDKLKIEASAIDIAVYRLAESGYVQLAMSMAARHKITTWYLNSLCVVFERSGSEEVADHIENEVERLPIDAVYKFGVRSRLYVARHVFCYPQQTEYDQLCEDYLQNSDGSTSGDRGYDYIVQTYLAIGDLSTAKRFARDEFEKFRTGGFVEVGRYIKDTEGVENAWDYLIDYLRQIELEMPERLLGYVGAIAHTFTSPMVRGGDSGVRPVPWSIGIVSDKQMPSRYSCLLNEKI